MATRFQSSDVFRNLRRKAEQMLLRETAGQPAVDELDMMRLAHELEVQYVELELQNEELRRTTKDLEASRDAFAELYQSAPVSFVTLNDQGVIEQVNAAAARLLSNPHTFLTGRPFLLLIHPDDRERFHARLAGRILEPDTVMDLRLMADDGRLVHAQAQIDAVRCASDSPLVWRLALVDITLRKQYEEALEESRQALEARVAERTAELRRRTGQLARMTSELTLAEQRERRRIAELLHDHLQQMLAGLRLNLDLLAETHALTEDPVLQESHQWVMEAIQMSRSLSAELSPPVLYMQGLSGALEWLARWMSQTHKLAVAVEADPAADPAREDIKVLLFQSVRELLFNVVKHAGLNRACVETTRRDGRTVITVSDQGAGFDVQALWERKPGDAGGFGLFSIRERVTLLEGEFEIASTPGEGTTATISLPLEVVRRAAPGAAAEPPPDYTGRPAGDRIRVMLVDDHAMVRKGLALLLMRHEDIEVAGEAEDGRQAIEVAREVQPDVILMDINMPVMNGLEATRRIHAELPRNPHHRPFHAPGRRPGPADARGRRGKLPEQGRQPRRAAGSDPQITDRSRYR